MYDPREDRISRRQMTAMGWVALLAPLIRQIPGSLLGPAGRTGWLAIPAAALPLWGLSRLLGRFLKNRGPDEGLGEMFCRALGRGAGRAAALAYTIWLVLYTGFVLRAGADRFIAAVYPQSHPWIFMGVMLVLGLVAALGRLRTLARCAQVSLPLLAAVFWGVMLFALPEVDWGNLVPVTVGDLPGTALAVLPMTDTLGILAFMAFLQGRVQPGQPPGPAPSCLLWLLLGALALFVTTVGTFGAELAQNLHYPFFAMIRGIRIFDLLDRVEALVVAQWVITDFILVSMLLQICSGTLTLALRGPGVPRRRWLAAGCAAAAALAGWLCAPTSFALRRLTLYVFPLGNAVFIFAGLPLIFLVGRLRKTI